MAKKFKGKPPQNRSLDLEMDALGKYSREAAAANTEAAVAANRAFIDEALDATDRIAGRLNNAYTQTGVRELNAAMGQVPRMNAVADRLGTLGAIAAEDVGGTEIERMLQDSAVSELSLGRMLSDEEKRAADQSARGAFAARGMAVGKQGALAEILNRESAGTARLGERRQFASGVNQMVSGNRLARLGQAGSLAGQEAGTRQNTAQLGIAGAQGYVALDPYQRALQSNIPIAAIGPSASMTTDAFGRTLGYVQDLNNTSFNADWSNFMNQQNMWLAQNGPKQPSGIFARMMAGASAGGQIGGPYGALGGAFDGATNGPIYQEYSKQTGAPK